MNYQKVSIILKVGNLHHLKKGLECFHNFCDLFISELPKRCLFIVDNITLKKVGTATISLLKEPKYGYDGAVDWIAIKKRYQG